MNTQTSKFDFPAKTPVMIGVAALLLVALGWLAFEWTVNRVYVPKGSSLVLRYKGPPLPFLPGGRESAEPGSFAKVDENGAPLELGVLEQMVGPGRHFYCPLWWERDLVKDVVVKPGEVGLVSSKMGKNLPNDEFLVDGDLGSTEYKGILRKVFAPGRYRVNTYAYDMKTVSVEKLSSGSQIKYAGWVQIPAGYVGVVTNLTDNKNEGNLASKGIQERVLHPGIYPINPREQQVDVVNIGFRENSITANLQQDANGELRLDESGEPLIADDESGISFPSKDGFRINMDFTAIWGIMPDEAPNVIKKFGNVEAVENKVVLPQIESICRNEGSKLGAVELLVGESRQEFQESTSTAFKDVLESKDITLLYGLVRHIYIPQQVRLPIQDAFIADELTLTREQEQITAKTEGDLEQARETVKLEAERVRVETDREVAKAVAEGTKTAEETRAETSRLIAEIDKETAELEAQATIVLGEADSGAKKMLEQARAEKFKLAVDAFGSGEAYNRWVFATGLPDDLELNMLYAGEGTFWTDLTRFNDVLLGRQLTKEKQPAPLRPAAKR